MPVPALHVRTVQPHSFGQRVRNRKRSGGHRKMPVLEVVLAAVGLSVGGPRAWRKLRGLPEEDGACQRFPTTAFQHFMRLPCPLHPNGAVAARFCRSQEGGGGSQPAFAPPAGRDAPDFARDRHICTRFQCNAAMHMAGIVSRQHACSMREHVHRWHHQQTTCSMPVPG